MKNNPVIICRCEDITEDQIVEMVRSGIHSIEELKRYLRVCMGPCQGRTCSQLIARIISRETGIPVSELLPSHVRQPSVPVPLSVIAKCGGENENHS